MRYALCLHGLVGNTVTKSGSDNSSNCVLSLSYKHLEKHILRFNNIDIFIHSWDKGFEKDIVKTFKPKKYIIEEQKKFEVNNNYSESKKRVHNHYSRWFSFMRSVDIKSSYEKEKGIIYDGVMVSRFDVAWLTDLDFSIYDMNYFYASKWYRGDKERKDKNKVKDIWFFSSSKNIDKFSNLYHSIDIYNSDKSLRHEKLGISSHYMAVKHCREVGLDLRRVLRLDEKKGGLCAPDSSDYVLIRHLYKDKDHV